VGYDLFAAIAFLTLTPAVVLGFVAFWIVTARDREDHAGSLRVYARARGLEYLAPERDWPNRTSAAVAWQFEGAELRLSTVGKEARARTRLTVRPRNTLLGALIAVPDDDDPTHLRIQARPATLGARLLDPQLTRALLGFRQRDHVVLRYRRGRFQLEWPGREANDARLDHARTIGEDLVRVVESEFPAGSTRSPA